jgi:hypothetical protein
VTTDDMLTTSEFAAIAGVSPATLRGQVSRGQAPPADDPGAGPTNRRTPRWRRSTIDTYLSFRPGPGARTDLPSPGWRYGSTLGVASLAAEIVDSALGTTEARDRVGRIVQLYLRRPPIAMRLAKEAGERWRKQLRRIGVGQDVAAEIDTLLAEMEQVPQNLPYNLTADSAGQAIIGYHHRRGDVTD